MLSCPRGRGDGGAFALRRDQKKIQIGILAGDRALSSLNEDARACLRYDRMQGKAENIVGKYECLLWAGPSPYPPLQGAA